MEHLLRGSCHCGAVQLVLPHLPSRVTECNCSICRRLAGIWGYFDWGTVRILAEEGALDFYAWGDKSLRTMRCATCGCATHWEPIDPQEGAYHGVNLRMFPPELLSQVRIRKFDGADTWTYLDEQGSGAEPPNPGDP
ncbi:MAG: hypothetical protein J7598_01360 [Mitsuaria chitosanitabida]|uniref:GFA family protein n=1 Tax=Roseateles chitosanitabidus TaxID=65048 RepID=UPI001B2E808A|nr:hypothetical protein [Roseateles chitosanitabidus]MBO9685234.1 hypothetical protein [Roseateles chitosanitabidus]